MKIISLVPSLTELLYDLGLENQIVGVTKFCIHPEHLRKEKTIIGGTKNFRFEAIKALNPDLIIANKEENHKEGIEYLQKEGYNVLLTDIYTYEDAQIAILDIGKATGTSIKAEKINQQTNQAFAQLPKINANLVYLIWQNPTMCAGKNTFIDSIISKIGMKNAINEQRYPEITDQLLVDLSPDYLLLSSEPYPFKEKDVKHFQKIVPKTRVLLVDGELFSWYGSRMLKAPDYFNKLFLS